MKTYQDLIDHFADRPDVQAALFEEIKKSWIELYGNMSMLEPQKSLHECLVRYFEWEETKHGYEYWMKLWLELEKSDL